MGLERFFGRRKKLHEGPGKVLYEGPDASTFVQYFKDDVPSSPLAVAASTDNNKLPLTLAGKGVLNNRISAHLMTRLESMGIPTYFIRSINMREQLVRKVEPVPITLTVRNVAAGALSRRLGIKEGTVLPRPLIEFNLINAELGNPQITEDQIFAFGWADPMEIDEMGMMAWRVNDYLSGMFAGVGLTLIDFRLEFGRLFGEYDELYILLSDEISPDTCRIWDMKTGQKFDKSSATKPDGTGMIEAYQEVAKRLGLVPDTGIIQGGNVDEQIAASLESIENELSQRRKLRSVSKTPPSKPWKV
ncbi:MAG: phosphoribosylaminoimidazolesuccinocarboxamide synthase [Pseudomonadota bacterium]